MKRVFCSNDFVTEQMEIMREELGISVSDDGVRLKTVRDSSVNGLEIVSNSSEVTVRYSELAYLFRAMGIISEREDEEYIVRETARFSSNGVMIDCSRNAVLNIDTVKSVIRIISRMGLKMLMLYTEDTYEIEGHPYIGYMRGRYSIAELKELDEYAYSFGVELVPCIQTLGHLAMLLKWQQYDFYRDTDDILYVDKDKTYALIERMIQSCRNSFRTNRIHIGMDEAEMIGRGNYYYLNGDSNKPELVCRHLNRVAEICKKYDFSPMIWSDMLFKFANDGNYRGHNPLPEWVIKMIPQNVTLVYWEYLREDREQYDVLIKNHMAVSPNTVFAGGLWKWMSFLPSIAPSIRRTKTALNSCYANGVGEVFTTVWGDGGADASFFSILPALQVQAELGFYDDIDDAKLAQRLKTCAGAELKDFEIIDLPDVPAEKNNGLLNPNKYLLFQDVMMGLLDSHIPEGTADRYAELYKKAKVVAEREGRYQYIFKSAAALYDALSFKAELGIQLKGAYDKKDIEFLKKASNEIIPSLVTKIEYFYECYEKQWLSENKPFGLEVQGQRIGGLILRLKSASNRIRQYVSGEVKELPELAERRLPFGYSKEGEFTCLNNWSRIVTASYI